MELKIKLLDWSTGLPVVMLDEETAKRLGVHTKDRIFIETISGKHKKISTIIDTIKKFIGKDELVVSSELKKSLDLKSGQKVLQETRGWNENRRETVSQRKKEEAHDYRYFPEPDLPRLHFGTPDILNGIKAEIPELPHQKRKHFKKEYSLPDEDIEVFVLNKDFGGYFEQVMSELRNWVKEAKMKEKISEAEYKKLIKLYRLMFKE